MKIVLTRDEIKKIVADRFNLSVEEFILQISAELATSPKHSTESIITIDGNGFIQNTKKIDEPSEEEKKEAIKESAEEFKKYFSKKEESADKEENAKEDNDNLVNSIIIKPKRTRKKIDNSDKPKRTVKRIDYRALADEVERFLASNINEIDLPIDPDRTASGIHHRYKTATEMYNLDDKVKISEIRKANRCILIRKWKHGNKIKEHKRSMLFEIVKKHTEEETTAIDREITARQVGLDADSIDQFAITENGNLVIIDKSGEANYVTGTGYCARMNSSVITSILESIISDIIKDAHECSNPESDYMEGRLEGTNEAIEIIRSYIEEDDFDDDEEEE